jgi:AcrR family transcriptional regulator
MAGLRERKKRELRQRISDVATGLFALHGFDAVSVEQIAAEVGVSKVTIFNYFARKEDLVLDREEEMVAMVDAACRGGDPIGGFRTLLVRLAREGHPLMAAIEGAPAFWKLISSSPVLLARAWQTTQAVDDRLAAALLAAGHPRADAEAAAGMAAAVWRAAWRDGVRRVEAGEPLERIRGEQAELVQRAIGAISAAFGLQGALAPTVS